MSHGGGMRPRPMAPLPSNITELVEIVMMMQGQLRKVEHRAEAVSVSYITGITLISCFLVFLMQLGFTMLEVGMMSRASSVYHIVLKNVLDTSISCLVWWLVGFGFAYGDGLGKGGNQFIGDSYFSLSKDFKNETGTFFLVFTAWTFAATTSTIVSGAIAERTRLLAYLGFCALSSGLVYPVTVHWIWSDEGFMSPTNTASIWLGNNFLDVSGSSIVHMSGGISGLIGAWVVGPRLNRFDPGVVRLGAYLPHKPSWSAVGTIVLWFCWYAFNTANALRIRDPSIASVVALNNSLAASSAALVSLALARFILNRWDLGTTLNGILAGLVAITAGCSLVAPWAAVVIGVTAGGLYFGTARLLERLHIDDVVDAFAVHGVAGFWGTVAVGLFTTQHQLRAIYGRDTHYGLFMGGGGEQLAAQMMGLAVVIAWVAVFSFGYFIIMEKLGVLRMDSAFERRLINEHLRELNRKKMLTNLEHGRGNMPSGNAVVDLRPRNGSERGAVGGLSLRAQASLEYDEPNSSAGHHRHGKRLAGSSSLSSFNNASDLLPQKQSDWPLPPLHYGATVSKRRVGEGEGLNVITTGGGGGRKKRGLGAVTGARGSDRKSRESHTATAGASTSSIAFTEQQPPPSFPMGLQMDSTSSLSMSSGAHMNTLSVARSRPLPQSERDARGQTTIAPLVAPSQSSGLSLSSPSSIPLPSPAFNPSRAALSSSSLSSLTSTSSSSTSSSSSPSTSSSVSPLTPSSSPRSSSTTSSSTVSSSSE